MDLNGTIAILGALIGLPWLIFHYVTKWKTAPKITNEDEQLLDDIRGGGSGRCRSRSTS